MKRAILLFTLSAICLIAILAVRILRPPQFRSTDPEVNRLTDRRAELVTYKKELPKMEDRRVAAQIALWTPKQLDAFAAELPKDWNFRPISAEKLPGVTMQRIALSRDASLRDYPEFNRVLKKLESHAGTRIDSVTLTLGADNKKFSASLITATLPTAPSEPAPRQETHPAATVRAPAARPLATPAAMPSPTSQ